MLTNKEQSALISKLLRAEVKGNIDRIGIWQILGQDTNLQNKIKKYQHLSYIYGISGVVSFIVLFIFLNIAPPKTWLKGALMIATIIIPAIFWQMESPTSINGNTCFGQIILLVLVLLLRICHAY